MRRGTKLVREIQLTDWSTAGNLSNRSSGVQIPRDICTRFGRYLYSTRCSWIIKHISVWTSSTLNNILTIGNNLYISIRQSVQANDLLLLTDVPCIVSLYNKVYTLQYSESLAGSLFLTLNNGPYMSLQNSLTEVFSSSGLNYNCCLLTAGINTVAVFKISEQSFKI